jgi:hypothetical protein
MRVGRLETRAVGVWVPEPEGAVLYDGPRDPVAIVRMLGLEDMEAVMLDVLTVGAVSGQPPLLVGGTLTKSGRAGMSAEFRAVDPLICQHAGSGASWGLYWQRGGRGFVYDYSAAELVTEYDCSAA